MYVCVYVYRERGGGKNNLGFLLCTVYIFMHPWIIMYAPGDCKWGVHKMIILERERYVYMCRSFYTQLGIVMGACIKSWVFNDLCIQ